jgi:2-succinyl-6-hydroxy-2,4-cyclohexadiene-1-carboxylate synthase
VLLHGFTQTSNCWGPLAEDLATDHELVLVDAPGHGDSDEVHADLETSALLSGAIGGPATYLGYSMGGRTALHLALARPDLVERLILIGATGGLDDEHERAGRRDADELLADRVEAIGVDEFVDEWLRQPLFSALAEEVAHRSERCTNTAEGLARSLRTCGTGTQRPLWSELNQLEMPVIVLAGASDAKFSELGARLCASIGANATFAAVPESGHSAHLENPTGTAVLIRGWLGRS